MLGPIRKRGPVPIVRGEPPEGLSFLRILPLRISKTVSFHVFFSCFLVFRDTSGWFSPLNGRNGAVTANLILFGGDPCSADGAGILWAWLHDPGRRLMRFPLGDESAGQTALAPRL
jgi:hypothetical protein